MSKWLNNTIAALEVPASEVVLSSIIGLEGAREHRPQLAGWVVRSLLADLVLGGGLSDALGGGPVTWY